MKTTLTQGERVFMVVTSLGKAAFCNLGDLGDVVESLDTHPGYFTIYHFWNNKQKKVSKKYLRELYEARRQEQPFNY